MLIPSARFTLILITISSIVSFDLGNKRRYLKNPSPRNPSSIERKKEEGGGGEKQKSTVGEKRHT